MVEFQAPAEEVFRKRHFLFVLLESHRLTMNSGRRDLRPGAGEHLPTPQQFAAGSGSHTNSVSNCLWGEITQSAQKSAWRIDTQAPFEQKWQSRVSNHIGMLLSH